MKTLSRSHWIENELNKNYLEMEEFGVGWFVSHGYAKRIEDEVEHAEDVTPTDAFAPRFVCVCWSAEATLHRYKSRHDVDKTAHFAEHSSSPMRLF